MSLLIQNLLKDNLITQEQLDDAKDKRLGAKKPIHELLVEMNFIKEEELIRTSSKIYNTPILNIDKEDIDSSITKLIPYDIAKRYGVFPLRMEGNNLSLAMSNPQDIIALDDLRCITKKKIKPILTTKSQISQLTEIYYQAEDSLYDILKNVVDDAKVETVTTVEPDEADIDIKALNNGYSPVIKIVNLIFSDAIKSRATDIHIEPQDKFIAVRYRIDGNLKNIMKFPSKLLRPLATRIKIISKLDIAESRKPQDGRMSIFINQRKVDLRVSLLPTFYGERVQLRILDPKEARTDLGQLGMEKEEFNIFTEAICKPHGIILITGPSGSGKTSTLYAALNFIKEEKHNIVTIEDPIEYLIEGISQVQLNPLKNLTFSTGLRSVLRQDPDTILVGEIRDRETADIAFRSSLTGHLVFSTLHTNNSVGSITRLLDIGLEPYLISSTLSLVVAQRLVRLICPHCKQKHSLDATLRERFDSYIKKFNIKKFYIGKGCKQCNYTGYFGRIAIFELLEMNENICQLIASKAPEHAISNEAKKNGLKPLVEAGVAKVAKGITTLEEVSKVTDVLKSYKAVQKIEKPGRNIKVLIADDEEGMLKILEKRLSKVGYEVIKARDGEELIEAAVRKKPNLIITDVTMPKMDGFKATRILRSKLETAVIPIMMLTGRKDKENELKGISAGADDYITKPFDHDKLLARIKMLLRRGL